MLHSVTLPESSAPSDMQALRYSFTDAIASTGPPSYLPDVEFSPSGHVFAVTERDRNRVRVYDSRSRALLRDYEGAASGLDYPHGLALTDTHLVVSSAARRRDAETFLSSFALQDESPLPVARVTTPRPDLREPHSLALVDDFLYCTYCEGERNGLAVFPFDQHTGGIGACCQFVGDCFDGLGEPKGVAHDHRRQRLLVSFVAEKHVALSFSNVRQKLLRKWRSARGPVDLLRRFARAGARRLARDDAGGAVRNGIMAFRFAAGGGVEPEPDSVLESPAYVRLENIDVRGDRLAIADPVNNRVTLYDLADADLAQPLLRLTEAMAFPHDVAIAPDGETLLVANYGIGVHEGEVLWNCYDDARLDRVVVLGAAA